LSALEADAEANPAKYAQPVQQQVTTGEGLLQRAMGSLEQYPADVQQSLRSTAAMARLQGMPASDVAAQLQHFVEETPPETFAGPPRPGMQPPAVGPVAPGAGAELGVPSLGGVTPQPPTVTSPVVQGALEALNGYPRPVQQAAQSAAETLQAQGAPEQMIADRLQGFTQSHPVEEFAPGNVGDVGVRMASVAPEQAPALSADIAELAGGARRGGPAPPQAPPGEPPVGGPPTAPPPGQTTPPPPEQAAANGRTLFNLYYRGNLVSGGQTFDRIGLNAAIAPAWNGTIGMAWDLATFNPSRLQAGPLAMVSAYHAIASDFVDSARTAWAQSRAPLEGANPLMRLALTPQAAVLAVHGGLRNLTIEGLTRQELVLTGGQDATRLGLHGQEWIAHAIDFANSPTPEALDMATRIAQEGAFSGSLGRTGQMIAGWLDQLEQLGKGGTMIGDAIWPVFRIPWKMATVAAEYSPMGFGSTVADILSGVRGQGPYAGATTADILPSIRRQLGVNTPFQTPAEGSGVAPMAQRFQHGFIGTAITIAAALKGLEGNVTGAGPDDPELRRQMMADGWRPYSINLGGRYYSYDQFPQFALTLGLIGDYHDAVAYSTDVERAQAQAGLGGGAIPMGLPLGGGGGRADATALRLATHVLGHMGSLSGLSNLVDTLSAVGIGGGGGEGTGLLQSLATEAGGVLGPLVPLSGLQRTVALARDVAERRPLPANVPQILAQNIPGLRETVPAALSPSGQPLANVQTGLAAIAPVKFGPPVGADPISHAFTGAGLTLSGTPPSLQLGGGSNELARQMVIARGPAATTLASYVSPAMAVSPADLQQAFANQQALRGALGLPTSRALLQQQLAG
jgi:hypothetical protein